MVIRDSVEPLLEDYRPPGITSLKFNKLTLGNVAPKIEGKLWWTTLSFVMAIFFSSTMFKLALSYYLFWMSSLPSANKSLCLEERHSFCLIWHFCCKPLHMHY